ncbi:MAG: hypothetical protein IJY10_06225 [Lachnospiraceae bacterium]|nr:hypothetical protein [Lachnospiraceae bacterium]
MAMDRGMPARIDSEQEYRWFLDTVSTQYDNQEDNLKLTEALSGLFYGVMRIVHGYSWLKDCPKGIDLRGKKISVVIEQDENGRMHNEILGRWEMTFQICDGETSIDTLKSIMSVMEKFVRGRFSVKEPDGLDAIALEYKRSALLKDHFIL